MACSYTSKTTTEIKAIIASLENELATAQATGKQEINYNGISYKIEFFIRDLKSQIEFWQQQLCVASEQEGLTSKTQYFSRGDGLC